MSVVYWVTKTEGGTKRRSPFDISVYQGVHDGTLLTRRCSLVEQWVHPEMDNKWLLQNGLFGTPRASRIILWCITQVKGFTRHGFVDAIYSDDPNTFRSISCCICLLRGRPIIWSPNKQPVVALSSFESEYFALAHNASQEAVYLSSTLLFYRGQHFHNYLPYNKCTRTTWLHNILQVLHRFHRRSTFIPDTVLTLRKLVAADKVIASRVKISQKLRLQGRRDVDSFFMFSQDHPPRINFYEGVGLLLELQF